MSGVLPELLDDDGYPTEAALEAIRKWPITSFDGKQHAALLEYVRDAFAGYGYFGITEDGAKRIYHVSTGGWSGCEAVIDALGENFFFWTRAWASSRRGGHYTFEFEVAPMKRPGLCACRDCGALSLGLASCPRCASRVVLELPESRESLSTHAVTALALLTVAYVSWATWAAHEEPAPQASAEAQVAWCATEAAP